ncbi:hypothetical protein VTP01DRAFT_4586 [Rhizomucor pusillus]|uniref:uncharacterized protein n=1 Tax=Rhizomucor pusillus TaxID=4840 RepID=UPI003742629E
MALGKIQPSEYYDQSNGGAIPVFRPSMEEFKDFKAFMEAIDEYGKRSGIVKVIPPKEWKDNLPDIGEALKHVRVRNPIIQHIMGSKGIYTQTNVEKRRPYTVEQWHNLCQQVEHRPPQIKTEAARPAPVTPSSRKRFKTDHSGPTMQPPSANTRSKSEAVSPGKKKREITMEELALAHSDRPAPLSFDPHCPDKEKYTVQYCKELERIYWRNLTFTQPMYGADMAGTLFDKSVRSWNVNSLDNILNQIGIPLPGVNEPYLYFGMWKATFAWHVEDMDLYSINYLHFGAPKQWYAIPTMHSKKFEGVMQNVFYQQYKECHEFLRHKTFIVSPKVLTDHSVPVHRCVQHEGEFIITFPFGYHAGYNLGFNCAESVNFALDSWLEIGKRAKACNCISDSVVIDISIFDQNKPTSVHAESEATQQHQQEAAAAAATSTSKSKSRKRNRHNFEKTGAKDKQCILCPDEREAELESSQGYWAHRICAEMIPEVFIEKQGSKDIVQGVNMIPKARWNLLCMYCKERDRGACIQCTKGRCYRAYHATCTERRDGTVTKTEADGKVVYETFCNVHDPKSRALREQEKIQERARIASEMSPGRRVSVRYPDGGEYKGAIVNCEPERQSSRIQFDDGVSRKIHWRNIKFIDQ